jgi:hypothetical protein
VGAASGGGTGALPAVKPLFAKWPPVALPCATKRSPLCKLPWPELFALPGAEPPSSPCLRRGVHALGGTQEQQERVSHSAAC